MLSFNIEKKNCSGCSACYSVCPKQCITMVRDEEGFVYLTGRKKNLIITKNGENVSPEELENKTGENHLVQEILVRESEGVIESEIFPDLEYAAKKEIIDIPAELQKLIDDYNSSAPAYKHVYRLKTRDTEFPKTPSKKIKRY